MKYRDGTWIECRKRICLIGSSSYDMQKKVLNKVQWNKYRAWGGKDIVMNTKFDAWWEDIEKIVSASMKRQEDANFISTRIQKQMASDMHYSFMKTYTESRL